MDGLLSRYFTCKLRPPFWIASQSFLLTFTQSFDRPSSSETV